MAMITMLTTVDNPFDPFTQWDEWFLWDMAAGYNTPGLLARFANLSHELSEAQQDQEITNAIDLIVEENFLGVHVKVSKEVEE